MLTVIIVLLIAFAAIGTIEWVKALVDGIKAKSWLPTAGTGLVSLVFAFILSGDLWQGVKNFFIILAAIELFYVLGVKTLAAFYGVLVAWAKKIIAEVEAILPTKK